MKKTGFISIEHEPGDPPIETDTDWAAVDALTDEQIEAAVRDDPDAAPIRFFEQPGFIRIPNVKRLREGLGLTQEAFAAAYHIPIGTLRDWEQRRKIPDATARAFLTVIARDPQAVASLLKEAA
ncbi:MAG: helix-turn-helix domain-containing protein [Terracidiphilus sp.]|jgi:putative transcriptional regulator